MVLKNILSFSSLFYLVIGTYPPIGDVVQLGSVLLPATRRGRYLANIVRRQAIDGTGIKFNRDADRMNAESKKKVDVLSEELLPYIISEQERRTTLHKRVMTALQNGEKGVTIAEIRNKPPLIIKRGVLYRCPSNRAPLEPDGSGVLKCEGDVEPSPIMYDSCLSAEDKDLYLAGNKVFFCNRHKVEGPDLPRNGSSVVGCAPSERTSLNYTIRKCAIEDSEDVVVHYRYYPDKSYTFVREMDPDHEVCDHWNPCQVGYIFSLPTIDQAISANDLWHYEKIVDEDFIDETVNSQSVNDQLVFSLRRVKREKGMVPGSIHCRKRNSRDISFSASTNFAHYWVKNLPGDDDYVYINPQLFLPGVPNTKWDQSIKYHYEVQYFLLWRNTSTNKIKASEPFLDLLRSEVTFNITKDDIVVERATGQLSGQFAAQFKAKFYRPKHIRLRSANWNVYNLNPRYWKITFDEDTGEGTVSINLGVMARKFFGSFFLVMNNPNGEEEKYIIVKIIGKSLKATELRQSYEVGVSVAANATYTCPECNLTDIVRNGESVLSSSNVQLLKSDTVIFNFPSFEDQNAGVYKGLFRKNDTTYEKTLAIIDNVTIPDYKTVTSPKEGTQFELEIKFTCSEPCTVEKVFANGVGLEPDSIDIVPGSADDSPTGVFEVTSSSINIRIEEYAKEYDGVYQAVFRLDDRNITKNIADVTGEKVRRMNKESLRSDASSGSKPVNAAGDVTTDGAEEVTEEVTTTEEVTDEVTSDVTDKVTSEIVTTDGVTDSAIDTTTVTITNDVTIVTTDMVTNSNVTSVTDSTVSTTRIKGNFSIST